MLTVFNADVLTRPADAIILPIDGTFLPAAEQYERLLGNVGRQFLHAFPGADLLEEIEAQVNLPLAIGKATPVDLGSGSFRLAILVSTLHHVDHLDQNAKRAVARESFSAALRVARQKGAASVATPILQGGWRLPVLVAFASMLQSEELGRHPELRVEIAVPDAQLAATCQEQARSLGFGRPAADS
jgi:hypothetical protein